ncbi:MAG TPA: hypothetical protein VND45_07215, partial [Thermoanaerobaculia bacterium]|nr:hypothetical protein [Thermoanaerobaculia bacterium]
PNACQVLTAADVKAVQGEAHSNAKLSTRGAATQCFYQLPSFVNSISLDLHREGREYWNEHFERKGEGEREERERERERELRVKAKAREEEEEGEKEHPPRRVRGVGDEAFWVGGQMAGSLYVRKGDAVLRVSVGGKGTDDQKIAKTKALAKKALKRL